MTRRWTILVISLLALGGWSSTVDGQESLLDRSANLYVRDVSLETALQQLADRASIQIAFSPNLARNVYPVACDCRDVTVGAALDSLLRGTELSYAELRNRIVIQPNANSGEPRTIGRLVGMVRGQDGIPIHAASVRVANRVGETWTDHTGRFAINLPSGSYDLLVRAMGFRPQRLVDVDVESERALTVEMEPAPVSLAEIVVMPSSYGILREDAVRTPHTLSRDQVQTRPHLGEDIFRAVDRLPGVATHDITARFQIRGGPYDQVLTLLDGVELIEPFHLQDVAGVLSIIDVEAVSNVSLLAGGFSAEYGDKMAGVFRMETTVPPPDRTTTTLGLSLQNVTIKNQGSFASGRGSWLVSARRGFLDLLLAITNGTSEGTEFSPSYYDALARVQYLLGTRHMLSVHALYAGDDVSMVEEDDTRLESSWGSGYVWTNWHAEFTDRLTARTTASVGKLRRSRFGSDVPEGVQLLDVDDRHTFEFVGFRQDWELLLSEGAMLKWGGDLRRGWADYDYMRWSRTWEPNLTDPGGLPVDRCDQGFCTLTDPDTLDVSLAPGGTELGAYLSVRVRPVQPLTVEAGLRYDRQSFTREDQIGPRINAALDVGPRTTVRGAWGYFYQSQDLHQLAVADGQRVFYGAQRAEHRIVGIQHRFGQNLSGRIEAYERRVTDPWPEYRNLEPEIEAVPEEGPEDRILLRPTRGLARGLEFTLEQEVGRVAWAASYALAEAKERLPGGWVPRPFEQRHTLNLEFAFRPSALWTLGWAWQYHSAWPSTLQRYSLEFLPNGLQVIMRSFGDFHGSRLPVYHRMDARVSRHFPIGRGRLSVFLDVFNVYDRTNALAWNFDPSFTADGTALVTRRDVHGLIGILPTIGARWEF